MATVSTPQLLVTEDQDNRIVQASYTIAFSKFDHATNFPYKHLAELIGDDTDVPGDPAAAAPDEVFATLKSETVHANGQTQIAVNLVQELGKSALNEDINTPNPDELRVRVTLTPILPVQVVRESNLYVEAIS